MTLTVWGKPRRVEVYGAEILLRGVWRGRAQRARVIIIVIIVVPGLPLEPWWLLVTDLDLDPCEAVRAYDGRYQIEVNMDEVKIYWQFSIESARNKMNRHCQRVLADNSQYKKT